MCVCIKHLKICSQKSCKRILIYAQLLIQGCGEITTICKKKMPKECLLLTPQMIRVISSLCLLLASWDGGFGIFQEFAEVPRESALRTSSPPSYLSGMPPAIGHKTNLPRISHVILGADSPHLHLRFGAAGDGGWGD